MARRSGQHRRNHQRLAVVLLPALALTAAVACTYNFIPGNPMPPTWETWSCGDFDEFL